MPEDHILLWAIKMPYTHEWYTCGFEGAVITFDVAHQEQGQDAAGEVGGKFMPYLRMSNVMAALGQGMKEAIEKAPKPLRQIMRHRVEVLTDMLQDFTGGDQ